MCWIHITIIDCFRFDFDLPVSKSVRFSQPVRLFCISHLVDWVYLLNVINLWSSNLQCNQINACFTSIPYLNRNSTRNKENARATMRWSSFKSLMDKQQTATTRAKYEFTTCNHVSLSLCVFALFFFQFNLPRLSLQSRAEPQFTQLRSVNDVWWVETIFCCIFNFNRCNATVMAKVFSTVRYINCIKSTRFSYQRENKLNNNKSQINIPKVCTQCNICTVYSVHSVDQVHKCRQTKCSMQNQTYYVVIFDIIFKSLFVLHKNESKESKRTKKKNYMKK